MVSRLRSSTALRCSRIASPASDTFYHLLHELGRFRGVAGGPQPVGEPFGEAAGQGRQQVDVLLGVRRAEGDHHVDGGVLGMAELDREREDGYGHTDAYDAVFGTGMRQGDAGCQHHVRPMPSDHVDAGVDVARLDHAGGDQRGARRPDGLLPAGDVDSHTDVQVRAHSSQPCSRSGPSSSRFSASASTKFETARTTGAAPANSLVCIPCPRITSGRRLLAEETSVASTRAGTPSSADAFSAVIRRMRLEPMPTPQTVTTWSGSPARPFVIDRP